MGGLVACRVLIGVFEAGFLPGEPEPFVPERVDDLLDHRMRLLDINVLQALRAPVAIEFILYC